MDRINGANTVDIGGGRRGWRKQSVAAGISGTEFEPGFFNGFQEELVGLIEAAGLAPDAADWTQLRQAIRSMIAAATGAPMIVGSSTTLVVPPGCTRAWYEAWGAGGGGGGTGVGSGALGSGGGGGEFRQGLLAGLAPGASLSVVIGAGGAGGAGAGGAGNGGAGGDTNVGSGLVVCRGGGGGTGISSGVAAVAGSAGSGGWGGALILGTGGELGFVAGSVYAGAAGGGAWGSGLGYRGVSYGPSLSATNATAPGQGGGGGVNGGAGGSGANGLVLIRFLP